VGISRRAVFSKVIDYNRAQTGNSFCVLMSKILLCKLNKRIKVVQSTLNRLVFMLRILKKPCTNTFSPAVISKCLRVWAHYSSSTAMIFSLLALQTAPLAIPLHSPAELI
jgi:hypothetical protein